MEPALQITARRAHLTRLMAIWRSASWPCRDAIEIDLVAAGWATLSEAASGHETIRLTDAGIRLLAESRQCNQRSLSAHDRLAERVAEHLANAGRIVWRELSLRAKVAASGLRRRRAGSPTPSRKHRLRTGGPAACAWSMASRCTWLASRARMKVSSSSACRTPAATTHPIAHPTNRLRRHPALDRSWGRRSPRTQPPVKRP